MAERRSAGDPIPERVGRYEILLPIASGGMATVYLARTRGAGGFERDVALKLTHAHLRESGDFARDLVEEAKLAVRIRHANVVPVIDMGDDPFGLFLVMEYIEGDTLSGLMRRSAAAGSPLEPRFGLRILLDALAGLHVAHELKDDSGKTLGVVHRDFSPQNILVGTDGVGRLTDFGIAKAATRLDQTRTGIIKGKISYMSPEQARGQRVDRRCDVWAGGVMAWEILAGRRLYDASSEDVGLLFRIATEVPPRLRTVRPDVGAEIDEVVARTLTPDPDARIATAAELARELTRALRASRVELAESADVAEYVERLVGRRLRERRARAKEVLALRMQLGRVARTVDSSAGQTPSSSPDWAALDAAVQEIESKHEHASDAISVHTAMLEEMPDATQASAALTVGASPSAQRLGGVEALATEPATRTDTNAVAVPRTKKRPGVWLLLGALTGMAGAAVVLALAFRTTPSAPAIGASRPAATSTVEAVPTIAESVRPIASSGTAMSPSAAASALAKSSTAAVSTASKVPPTTTHTPPAATTKPSPSVRVKPPDLSKAF